MRPGEHGQVTVKSDRSRWTAATYVRDPDGRRRRVERSSDRSAEDARRQLQRHLTNRRAPLTDQAVTERTSLAELFEVWIDSKVTEDGVAAQTADLYRECWQRHGAEQLGELRTTELPTSRANGYLKAIDAKSQAKRLRVVLSGMFGLAVRYDVIAVNPIRETKTQKTKRKPAKAATTAEFHQIRRAVWRYTEAQPQEGKKKPGPRPAPHLPAFIELLMATGCRANEVLALRWCDIDLDSNPPTVTVSGTLIDHNKIKGKPLHRQEFRKGSAPTHTVVLPSFGVEALKSSASKRQPMNPVFANRNGTWMSLANLRRALREALPDELRWFTPHSCRRTVATVVKEAYGADAAQAQLSHAKLATTEGYFQPRTIGPDAREGLDRFAAGEESEG
jgi:integrase